MPKRKNLFGDCSPLQLKSHISTKDINKTSEESMQSIYEKTKAMLFEGSRKMSNYVCENLDVNVADMSVPYPLPGQLRLDTNGSLCGKAVEQENKQTNNTISDMEISCENPASFLLPGQMTLDCMGRIQKCTGESEKNIQQCCTCSHINNNNKQTLRKCADCGKCTCVSCMQQCHLCEVQYCSFCVITNTEDYLERLVCQQCTVKI